MEEVEEHIGSSVGVFGSFVQCVCRVCGQSGSIVIPYGSDGREMHSCEDHVDNVSDLAIKAKNYNEFQHIFHDRNNTYRVRISPEDTRDTFAPIEEINQGIYYNRIDGQYYVYMCNVLETYEHGWCKLSELIELNPHLNDRLTDEMRRKFRLIHDIQ